jgi:ribulose-5-phosphate 4-epimerase/fuculose-1-phosphate aldolase
MSDTEEIEATLRGSAARLAGKGLMRVGDLLSQRIPENESFVTLRLGADGAPSAEIVSTPLSNPPSGLHHRIYAERPDVGAILSGGLPWTSTLAKLGLSMPAIFDEQVRQLGVQVRRVPMALADDRPVAALSNGANGYCLDDGAICLGMGLERLLMNAEILEKCAKCFVLATSTGGRVHCIPRIVRFIANGRLRKDRKDAAERHLRGERSILKAGY